MQTGHPAFAQGLDVVTVDLSLEGGTLAKPAPRGHAGKGHGLAFGVVAAHFQQAVNHAKPVSHRTTGTAHVVTRFGVSDLEVLHRTLALTGREQFEPDDDAELGLGHRTATLEQRNIIVHGELGNGLKQGKHLAISGQIVAETTTLRQITPYHRLQLASATPSGLAMQ
ncbi:hypothetical protein GALL_498030 [mine drainage metagenome]|uniref:Uncharacterized protein n=1 Tax=mine drainage metagenome TaxID=410659 RepID=A0A1J5PAG0_9ZZZZ